MTNYGYATTTQSQYTSRPISSVQAARRLGLGTNLSKNRKKEKVTMINWLRNKLRNFVYEEDYPEKNVAISSDPGQIEESNTLRFTVTPARGGIIVQVRKYDRKNDDNIYVTHVIHDDEHVSERVAELVSMELLRA
jgi:hypothetical protein